MSEPKLTIPTLGLNASGGMRIISEIANYMVTQGWAVDVLCPEDASTPHFPLSDAVQITTYPVQGRSWIRILSALWQLCMISCKETTVCLANYYPTSFAVFFSWLLRGRNTNTMYLIQGYEPLTHIMTKQDRNPYLNQLFAMIVKLSYRLPLNKIVVSTWIQSHIKQDMMIIPNGVDTTRFYPDTASNQESTSFKIGAIGRTSSNKGFDVFCKAVQSFLDNPDIDIIVLSDQLAQAPNGMQLIQPQSDHDIRDFYQTCDVFVYPSRMEGFGLPPLEAMACGTATIITDSGGVLEYANENNAIIVAVDDDEAIREAILTLHNDPSKRATLRQAGLHTAKEFSKEAMLQKYQTYFERYKSL